MTVAQMLGSTANKTHGSIWLDKGCLPNRMPLFLAPNGMDQKVLQCLVRSILPKQAFEIVFMMTEKACPELPISRQTNTVAMPTEWSRNRRHNAYLATTICMLPSLGCLGCVFLR